MWVPLTRAKQLAHLTIPGRLKYHVAVVGGSRTVDNLISPGKNGNHRWRRSPPSTPGSPRESIVKITLAEPGGIGGKGLWRPVKLGIRPHNESKDMQQYLAGEFVLGDKS